jgi:methylated-DNA-[protein]-cysteine S-methyltransferase
MRLFFYQTALGKIGIAEDNNNIANLFFETDTIPKNIEIIETKIIKKAAEQLNAYLAGKLKKFSFPLAPKGTDFSQQVWKAFQTVPYGKTASYKDIATAAGNQNAARAAGSACNRNPIPIFIPCHRIIAGNGSLGGYRGGQALKKKLLALEKALI